MMRSRVLVADDPDRSLGLTKARCVRRRQPPRTDLQRVKRRSHRYGRPAVRRGATVSPTFPPDPACVAPAGRIRRRRQQHLHGRRDHNHDRRFASAACCAPPWNASTSPPRQALRPAACGRFRQRRRYLRIAVDLLRRVFRPVGPARVEHARMPVLGHASQRHDRVTTEVSDYEVTTSPMDRCRPSQVGEVLAGRIRSPRHRRASGSRIGLSDATSTSRLWGCCAISPSSVPSSRRSTAAGASTGTRRRSIRAADAGPAPCWAGGGRVSSRR